MVAPGAGQHPLQIAYRAHFHPAHVAECGSGGACGTPWHTPLQHTPNTTAGKVSACLPDRIYQHQVGQELRHSPPAAKEQDTAVVQWVQISRMRCS